MDWKKQNIKVYDESAEEIAAYFQGIGSRVEDIERGLALTGKADAIKVIEVGCGDGRDAKEIIKRASQYIGIDPSEGLLRIAKDNNPTGTFILADALSYSYPAQQDIIFAFASLLHVNRNDLSLVFKKVKDSLRTGGIFYISLKERPEYIEEIKEDKYGQRMFYYYNPSIIAEISDGSLESLYEHRHTIGNTDWFTIALKKI